MVKKGLSIFISLSLILGIFNVSFAEKNNTPESKINHLINMKIIKGYGDGTLRLESSITRAEFSSTLAKIITDDEENIEKFKEYSYFSDVKEDNWASAYINFLFKESIVNGYRDNTYKPDNNITYNEVIAMIIRSLDVGVEKGESWSESYVKKAEEIGILNGVKISDYSGFADRQKVFELIYNTLEINK